MDHRRSLGRLGWRPCRSCQSPSGSGVSCLRSGQLRPWVVGPLGRAVVRATSPIRFVWGTPSSGPCRKPSHKAHRCSLVRPLCEQAEECRRVPRAQGEAPAEQAEVRSSSRSKTEEEPKGSKKGAKDRRQGRFPAFNLGGLDAEDLALDEDCRPDEVSPELLEKAVVHVPGAAAPTCNAIQVWNAMTRWILASSTPFSVFLKSLLSATPAAEAGTTPTWPMPVPYPEVWRREDAPLPWSPEFRAKRKAVNLLVVLMNWLHMNKPKTAPPSLSLASRPSRKQRDVVRRFERLMEDVAVSGNIDAPAMGRTAAKMESLDSMLNSMQQEAASWKSSGYEQRHHAQKSDASSSPALAWSP